MTFSIIITIFVTLYIIVNYTYIGIEKSIPEENVIYPGITYFGPNSTIIMVISTCENLNNKSNAISYIFFNEIKFSWDISNKIIISREDFIKNFKTKVHNINDFYNTAFPDYLIDELLDQNSPSYEFVKYNIATLIAEVNLETDDSYSEDDQETDEQLFDTIKYESNVISLEKEKRKRIMRRKSDL